MVPIRLRSAYVLSVVLAGLMAVQSVLGLLLHDQGYRDVAWIKLTWLGNDLVTLVVAVPLLLVALVLARRGSVRGLLLWLGMLGYAAYNYAYYMLGAAMNAFFPLYLAPLVLAVATIIVTLSHLDAGAVAASFQPKAPARIVGGYLVFVAAGLSFVWLSKWALWAFAGVPTPVEPEAFKLVLSLDMSIMVPAFAVGGVLLLGRHAWGHPVAAMAAVQGALYLLVLSVNSAIAIAYGKVPAPGELPIWGTLGLATAAATVALLAGARPATAAGVDAAA